MIVTSRWPRRLGLLGLTLALVACSGDVGGTLFVKMQSGDIKRGADVEVILVDGGKGFETEWKKAREAYDKARSEVLTPLLVISTARQAAFDEYMKDIGNASKKTRHEALVEQMTALSRQRDDVNRVHREHALKLTQWGKKAMSRTSVEGRYEFSGIKVGRYYIFAVYTDANNVLYWMVPIEIERGTRKLDLSNSNAGWPF